LGECRDVIRFLYKIDSVGKDADVGSYGALFAPMRIEVAMTERMWSGRVTMCVVALICLFLIEEAIFAVRVRVVRCAR
jgi:hypothetical protein